MSLKRILLVCTMAFGGTLPAGAALAPNYQRVAELKAVLEDSAVVEAFKVSQPIDRIEIIKADLYRITAGACHVDVAIVDIPDKKQCVGPRQFKVEIVDKTCPE